MSLDTSISLITVAEAKAFMGGPNIQINGMWVYYSGAETAATVAVNDNSLILNSTTTGDTPIDLTNASYDTMTELVTYIDGTVADWEAGLLCDGSMDSADLVTTGSLDAKGVANKQTLKIYDNETIADLINRASDFINRYCGRTLKTTTYSKEVYDGIGMRTILLEQYPVTEVTKVGVNRANAFTVKNTAATTSAFIEITDSTVILQADDGADVSITIDSFASINALITEIETNAGWSCTLSSAGAGAYDPALVLLTLPRMYCDSTTQATVEMIDGWVTDYYVEEPAEARNYGAVYKSGGWPSGNQNLFFWYKGGYTTIPYALKQACIELVKYKYGQSKVDAGLKSEKIGKVYAYERFSAADLEAGLSPELKAELDLFRRRSF